MFSFLVKDEEVMKRYPELSLLCAFSVLEVLNSFGISDLMIKWPNDVVLAGRKVCGILRMPRSAGSYWKEYPMRSPTASSAASGSM